MRRGQLEVQAKTLSGHWFEPDVTSEAFRQKMKGKVKKSHKDLCHLNANANGNLNDSGTTT